MSKTRSKILLAKKTDEVIEEDILNCYENERKEKFHKNMIKLKVNQLVQMENCNEIIKQNIENGKIYTQYIKSNIKYI